MCAARISQACASLNPMSLALSPLRPSFSEREREKAMPGVHDPTTGWHLRSSRRCECCDVPVAVARGHSVPAAQGRMSGRSCIFARLDGAGRCFTSTRDFLSLRDAPSSCLRLARLFQGEM